MKIDQLAYFIEAAKFESIQRAARALSISPSAISHSVAALEDELGRKLFTRERKRIFLTPHGRLLAERAMALQQELVRLKEDLSSPEVALEGYYRIAATQSLAARLLMPAWNELQKAHPRLRAEHYTFRTSELVGRAAAGELDLGIGYQAAPNPRLESRILGQEAFVIALRKGHPALRKRTDPKVVLRTFDAAMPKSSPERAEYEFHPALQALGIQPQVSFIYDTYETAAARLRSSDSWSLLPLHHVEDRARGLAALTLPNWKAVMDITAVWPRSRPPTRPLSELLRMVSRDAAAQRRTTAK